MTSRLALLLSAVLLLVGGCSTFEPGADVNAVPILVVGGWFDPGFGADRATDELRERLPGRPIVGVSPGFHGSFDGAAAAVVAELEKHFPSDDPTATIEVDVIAISMGGLTARHAATDEPPGKRLRVRRMFTLASPHSGALLAERWGFFGSGADMRPGSGFLADLSRREVASPDAWRYPIVQYARDRDFTIGEDGVELPEHLQRRGLLIRMPTPWYLTGHRGIYGDDRIFDDIVRRMKGDG